MNPIIFEIKNNSNYNEIVYKISLKNKDNKLLITTIKIQNNSEKYFENSFDLIEIQKVRYFIIYDSIDECMPDIISGIQTNNSKIIEEGDKLNLIIPLLNNKYKSISFILYKKFKNQVIKSQNILIEKLEKEIINLKNEINILKSEREKYLGNNFISINVEINNTVNKKFMVRLNDSINFVFELAKNEFNINNYNFCEIIYNGFTINDFNKSLQDYQIHNNSTINLNFFNIGGQYFIKTLSGKTITLELDKNETIFDIKEKINEKEGIPLDKLILTWAGKRLDDNRTILDYEIRSESTIFISLALR